ncbi:hypothetical protein GCM10023115_02110 [Pontixanthobacter gangjinensis]|uniref:Uncharacterized protein n=1 Tax=Pontixanthobacter gangjinensis TaxID=1028742 RepID=A0A6I4SIT5_9SPHN|nr:hypothetical protein [Pontixanthobacter gangjinensis]MXO55464.1 hypothetical protein [Pontixanthobacter gangjinensis]
MNKILEDTAPVAKLRGRDWRKSMSDHVAYALIIYTALHIFATVGAMKETGFKSLALFALVVLVVGIIPACRSFERRWRNLSDAQASDPSLAPAFRRDLALLWLLAIGLPFALTGLFKAIALIG